MENQRVERDTPHNLKYISLLLFKNRTEQYNNTTVDNQGDSANTN
jgi:hypothetical protein